MDDPQWLAHALMLSGLAVLLRRPGLPLSDVVLASLLVLAGGLTKHNLVALPGAVTIWLLIRDPRAGLAWCLTGTVGLAAAALWLGPLGLADILHYPRLYDLGGIMKGANRLLPLVPMIAITCAVLARTRSSRPASRSCSWDSPWRPVWRSGRGSGSRSMLGLRR